MVSRLSQYWQPGLVQLATEQFELDLQGDHGLPHWTRVAHHALDLAVELKLDPTLPALFALFHDSRRERETNDPEHGQRAGAWIKQLGRRGKLGNLSHDQIEILSMACHDHSEGLLEAHPIAQVCWDADRLDLGRVGIEPDPHRLCTEAAQDPQRIRNAYRWAQGYARNGQISPSLKKTWARMR